MLALWGMVRIEDTHTRSHPQEVWWIGLAERGGFEPPVHFYTHPFQGCTIDHSDISPRPWNCIEKTRKSKKIRVSFYKKISNTTSVGDFLDSMRDFLEYSADYILQLGVDFRREVVLTPPKRSTVTSITIPTFQNNIISKSLAKTFMYSEFTWVFYIFRERTIKKFISSSCNSSIIGIIKISLRKSFFIKIVLKNVYDGWISSVFILLCLNKWNIYYSNTLTFWVTYIYRILLHINKSNNTFILIPVWWHCLIIMNWLIYRKSDTFL